MQGFLTAAAAGAAVMYFLDPDRGRRRRALLRDQIDHYSHVMERPWEVTGRDLANRTQGLVSELRSQFTEKEVDDVVLAERIRSRLGRWLGHPGAIEVMVENGVAALTGDILATEVEDLLDRVSGMRGVRGLVNRMAAHQEAGDIPGLQGVAGPRGGKPEFLQEHWSPAARLIVSTGGAALALYGASRKDITGGLLGLAGLGFLARGIANQPLERLTGIGAGRRAVEMEKTIQVNAPVNRVFDVWSAYENFPRFMSHVIEVREAGPGRSHWKVHGPGGVPIEWDAVITKLVPNETIAWKTETGAKIEHSGIVRFDPTPDGRTRVDVKLSYNPAVGAMGHAAAALFRAGPKAQMDDDLMRMKSFIETGRPASDAAAAS